MASDASGTGNNRVRQHRHSESAFGAHQGRQKIVDNLGAVLGSIALPGSFGPTGVAIDSSGNIYIAYDLHQLRKYNSSFTLQWTESFGSFFQHIATDGTRVYVADGTNDNIRKRLCSNGSNVATYGSSGTSDGRFNGPKGICTDGSHLWIVDAFNNRVQQLRVAGVYVTQFAIPADSVGIARMTSGHVSRTTKVLDQGGMHLVPLRSAVASPSELVHDFCQTA